MTQTLSESSDFEPLVADSAANPSLREAKPQRFLMCRPGNFEVYYSINRWMDVTVQVDAALAMAQWENLRKTYLRLGHSVEVMDDVPGLPDMVFTANAGIIKGSKALVSKFRSEYRQPEEEYFAQWFQAQGFDVVRPELVNEGEGDFLWTGSVMLGGSGFRSELGAGPEVTELLGLPTETLELVDSRWYHIDTALAILDERTIAFVPEAFSPRSLEILAGLGLEQIRVCVEDAEWFALNAVSDGKNVVVAEQAVNFQAQLTEHGFTPVPVDVSEFLKSGGGAKCCTLILDR